MSRESDVHDLGDALVRLGEQAFAAGRYEVAYHALMGALHCASEEANPSRVHQVEVIADEQRTWIDGHAPGHRMSSQSAKSRGHAGPYRNLVRQAAATHRLIQHRQTGWQFGASSSADPEEPAVT